MELRTFIKQTLEDIVGGVSDAQESLPEGQIIPSVKSDYKSVEHGIYHIQTVEFEVLVNAEETKGKGAKIGVVSSLIGAGLSSSRAEGSTQSTKLKFKIPISFNPKSNPQQEK